jgi:hypothetical protein
MGQEAIHPDYENSWGVGNLLLPASESFQRIVGTNSRYASGFVAPELHQEVNHEGRGSHDNPTKLGKLLAEIRST